MAGRSTHSQLLPGDGALRKSIRAVCRAHDAGGSPLNKYAIRIDKHWHFVDVRKLINGKVDELVSISLSSSLPIDLSKAHYAALGAQIARAASSAAIVLDSSGYHRIRWDDTTYEVIVWRGHPHWFNEEPDVNVVVDDSYFAQLPEAEGTLEEWNEAIGKHFANNPYMMVALGAALSALLIRPLAFEPLMLILVGNSSIGKTAVQKAVQSIVRPGRVQSATGTALGLHQQMAAESDHPVLLQELRQVNDVGSLIGLVFDHGNSAQRVIGNASQDAVLGRALNCVLIGSNERTLSELARHRRVPIDAGVEARLLELYVQAPHGAFHDLPDDMEPAAFAEHLVVCTESLYGAPWDAWVEMVAKNMETLRDKAETVLPKMRAWLERKVDAEDLVLKRMLSGYAGWMFAAWYASSHDLFPATVDQIKDAFATVLKAHHHRRLAGVDPSEQSIIEEIRGAIDENPSRFVPLAQMQAHLKKNGLWGYQHEVGGQKLYLLFKTSLSKIAPDRGSQDVLAVLKAARMLKHNKDELMYSVRMPDSESIKRFYAIRESIRYDNDRPGGSGGTP